MIVDLRPPLIPPGSHVASKSKFGHEMIARGRAADGTELVSTTEPGSPRHFITLAEASERYRFCAITPPVSHEHAAEVIDRDDALIESEQLWEPGKNCQHEARFAYAAKPESPTLDGLIKALAVGGFVYAGIKLFGDN
jgi:hypothetical protein